MIDQIFKDLQGLDGVALFVDDGAMWKMGRTIEFIVSKMQDTVYKVQQRGVKWGFRISIEKKKVMFFTRTEISQELKIMMPGKELERVEIFKYLGVWNLGVEGNELANEHAKRAMGKTNIDLKYRKAEIKRIVKAIPLKSGNNLGQWVIRKTSI